MTVLKILKSLWLKIRPYTSKRCCAVFLFIWDLLIQNPLRFLRNLNTGELWLQKSGKIVLFCLFYLLSQTNKTNRTAAHKFKSLLLRQKQGTDPTGLSLVFFLSTKQRFEKSAPVYRQGLRVRSAPKWRRSEDEKGENKEYRVR